MKILYVIDSLGTGGAERDLAETLPLTADHGLTPIVVALRRRSEGLQDEVLRMGYKVRFMDGVGFLARVVAVRRLIWSERPDLVHTVLLGSDLTGRLAAWGTGVKVLSSVVETKERERPAGNAWARARARMADVADCWTARHLTSHVHANSQTVKAAAMRRLGIHDRRITVIEGGRDPGRLGEGGPERRRSVRARLGLDDRDEVLVSVGRQDEVKGHRFLLEAVAALAPRRPRLRLIVAGRAGESSPTLQELCDRWGLRDRVRFLGHREDVPDILAAADVFVFPSIHEGLPGAVIEAMALARPIVASDIGAIREMVEHGKSALLVEPRSPAALAAAIEPLLDETNRAHALGQCARSIFEARFTLQRSIARRVALYRSICSAR